MSGTEEAESPSEAVTEERIPTTESTTEQAPTKEATTERTPTTERIPTTEPTAEQTKPAEITTEASTVTEEVTTESIYDEDGYLKDELPDLGYEEMEINILTWQEQKWDWCYEVDAAGTSLNAALYNRDRSVEDRLGIILNIHAQQGSWSYRREFAQTVVNNTLCATGMYDIVDQYTPTAGLIALQGCYTNLYHMEYMEYLDFDKPWWLDSLADYTAVGDKLFFATGDITLTALLNSNAILANVDLLEAYNISYNELCEVVMDGSWTLEYLTALTKQLYVPESLYALEIPNVVFADAFFYSAGLRMVENTNGILQLSESLASPKTVDYADRIKTLFYDTPEVSFDNGNSQMFRNGKAAFYVGDLAYLGNCSVSCEFSVRPLPFVKMDEEQKEYITCTSLWASLYSVPIDARDLDASGAVLEALASQSYRTVTPTLYEYLLQIRYDETAWVMLDIIRSGIVMETPRIFADAMGSLFVSFRSAMSSQDSWTTVYASQVDAWKLKIESVFIRLA